MWCLIYAIVNAQEHHFGSIWQIKNNRNAHEDAPSVLFKLLWFAQESLIWGWQTQEEIHIDALLNSFFFIHLSLLYDITLTFLFFELKKSSTGKKLKKKTEEKSSEKRLNCKKDLTNHAILTRINANYHYFESIVHAWFPMNESTSNKQIYYYKLW